MSFMFQHQSIPTVSKIVRALVALFLLMQIASYTLLVMFGSNVDGTFELSEKFYFFSSAVNIDFSGSWENLAQALTDEGFNALVILGTADLLPSLLIYFSLFKLFGLYQQGLVFTTANIQCIKNY